MDYIYIIVLFLTSVALFDRIGSGLKYYLLPSAKRTHKIQRKMYGAFFGVKERNNGLRYLLYWWVISVAIFIVSLEVIPIDFLRVISSILFFIESATFASSIIVCFALHKLGKMLDDVLEDPVWKVSTIEEKNAVIAEAVQSLNKNSKKIEFELNEKNDNIKQQILDAYFKTLKEEEISKENWDHKKQIAIPNPIVNFLNIMIQFIVPIIQLSFIIPVLLVLIQNFN